MLPSRAAPAAAARASQPLWAPPPRHQAATAAVRYASALQSTPLIFYFNIPSTPIQYFTYTDSTFYLH
ncbi:hypothetical protein U9M48_036912 [Paspalum notatum var. saurae]|uniref:Uncharacterized protein n=1 Tax=Paspalum notatum var. saurae TaxID=547442 RepID=A0AAQ3XBT1_PASNO